MSDQEIGDLSSPDDKSKRNFLYGLSLLLGGTAVTQLIGCNAIPTALDYTPAPDSASHAGKIFSQADMVLLRDICALVIPKTDTAGAAEVDTHGFIDNQLYHCYPPEDQQKVTSVLLKINQIASQRHQQIFSGTTAAQQLALLTDLEKPDKGFDDADRSQFKFLKSQIVFGYYTSEVGASQELEYLAIPGGFTGSIPYDSVGKTWGSMNRYF
ncbi:MAG: gluconate 2-dehydrogenase subunit 3 family protein [Halioglobus sp.]